MIIAFHPTFSALSRSCTTPPSGLRLSLIPPVVKITPASASAALSRAALSSSGTLAGLELTKVGMAHARRETIRSPPE